MGAKTITPYLWSAAGTVAATIAMLPLRAGLETKPGPFAITFLLLILGVAFLWGLAPALFVAALSALAFVFFFVPPFYSLTVDDPRDLIILAVYLVVGIAVGLMSTRAKRTETRLSRIAAIVDSTGDAITSVDLDRVVMAWNRGAEKVFGYRAEEMIGQAIVTTIPEHRAAEAAAFVERVKRGEVIKDIETERIRRDGTVIPVALTISPVIDAHGIVRGVSSIARDITDRKQVDEALRTSEQRFRDYAEVASDWFWETGPDHRFTYVSEPAASFGVNPATFIGKRRWDSAADVEDDPTKWQEHQATLNRHEPFRNFVFKLLALDGTFRFVSISGKPMTDSEGRFAGYRGAARDVTQTRLADLALHAAKAEADAANQAKSRFLANMSHELRTPLNAIIGFAQILSSGLLGTVDQDRYRSYAEDIRVSGEHLLEIINSVLDVAKIEAGKVELDKRSLRLDETVAAALRIVSLEAEQAGLSLACDFAEDLPQIHADERSIRQIVLNLLSNAIKFTPRAGTVTVGIRNLGERGVHLWVADTGIGIAPEDLPRLTEPFTQLDSDAYRRRHHGTGLGLTLVRSLAELHGGKVTIESAPGSGTVVNVFLPAAGVDEARSAAGE